MRINLRRRQISVAQQFLDRVQVSAVVRQVRGKRMPQHVRAALLQRGDQRQVALHGVVHKFRIQFRALVCQEKMLRRGAGESSAAHLQIRPQLPMQPNAKRHQPLLFAFAEYANHALLKIHILHPQAQSRDARPWSGQYIREMPSTYPDRVVLTLICKMPGKTA